MAGVTSFFSVLGGFIWAVVSNWVFYMTALPLVLDGFIKWCSPKASRWIGRKLAGPKRRRVEIYLMFAGFFIASFMAFDGEHDARVKAESASVSLARKIVDEPVVKIETTDALARKENDVLKSELDKITNPLNQPIKSASVSFSIIFSSTNSIPTGIQCDPLCFCILESDKIPIFIAQSDGNSIFSKNRDGSYKLDVNGSSIISDCIGKPVSILTNAICIKIQNRLLPKDANVIGGAVTWVVNIDRVDTTRIDSIKLNFDVPAQKYSGQCLIINDLKKGLETLTTPKD